MKSVNVERVEKGVRSIEIYNTPDGKVSRKVTFLETQYEWVEVISADPHAAAYVRREK